MCGIAGEFLFAAADQVDERRAASFASILRHRGPDEWGYHIGCARSALLVSTRLSIVDLVTGRQPIPNEDRTIWVVLNGEIYGFADIVRRLERQGHRFRTRTDTEVIVHLYEEHGDRFVDHLRGEFAIALLDERRRELYLVRDRFGIKPLYYAEVAGGIVFGSEIKALFRHPHVRRRLNRRRVLSTLYGLLPPGETYFDGVHEVEPGMVLRACTGGVTRRRYWDLPFPRGNSGGIDGRDAIHEFRHLLHEAVRLRLHGDVDVGVFLSGGVDSSSIAAVAADLSGRQLQAFTIGFANRRFDEGLPAAEMAARERFDHRIVTIGPGDLAAGFERCVWHSEIALVNSHAVAKLLLSELAGRSVKVVLTGEGADEALAGYAAFRHLVLLERVRQTPHDRHARRDIAEFVRTTGIHNGVLPFREYQDYERISRLFGVYPYAIARALKVRGATRPLLTSRFRAEMSGFDPIADIAMRVGSGMAGLDAVSGHQYYAFKADLAEYILACLGDRVEMANSVEGRVPFLDHPLVEFVCRLPTDMKVKEGVDKYLLRQTMAARVPQACSAEKRPFMAPSAETLGLEDSDAPLGQYLDKSMVEAVGLFHPHAIAALRHGLRLLPRRSYAYGLAETLLTVVASVHALHDLFCSRFEQSSERFSTKLHPDADTVLNGTAAEHLRDFLPTLPTDVRIPEQTTTDSH